MEVLQFAWHILNTYEILEVSKGNSEDGELILVIANNGEYSVAVGIFTDNREIGITEFIVNNDNVFETRVDRSVHPDDIKALSEHNRIRLNFIMEG
ncbi:hypothetical protein [Neobacillus soli]|uniref:hypothetical protein n=1 Tax=Neobacillus soli TaxID=220688 RepID=UPI000824D880|nr:hypothetical protein [Neobacillus soli]